MRISVVIPCYRSAAMLPELVSRTDRALQALVEQKVIDGWELILVVDGSLDQTGAVAASLAKTHAGVMAAELHRNYGQHSALLAGIRLAANDVIVTMDDDLQHPPEEIGALLGPLSNDEVDLVYGVPYSEEHGVLRSGASRLVKAALSVTGVPNAQWVGAFRAFRMQLRDAFAEVSDPSPNIDVLLSWATSSVRAAPVRMEKRKVGRSGYTLVKLVKHAMNMVTGYGTLPLRLATWFGFCFGALGFVTLVYVLVTYVAGITTQPGFTTTVGLIALFAGVQLVTIGIIGEYIGRSHFRSMNKPSYFIRTITRHDPLMDDFG
jgi:glycosyltransferase involved in cell wall biosynthesis